MDGLQKELNLIRELLKTSPKGLTIKQVSEKLGIGRNSVAKYLDMMRMSGHVEMRTFGRSKIYSVSSKISIATELGLSSDMIVLIDDDLTIVEANQQLLKHSGMKRSELIGRSMENTTVPLFLQREILLNIREALRGKEYAREVKIQESNDENYYRVKLIPITPGDVHPKVAIVYENITSRMKTEIALKESEARYRAVVEEQSEMIVRLKPDTTIVFVNEPWCRFFRAKKEEVAGKRFGDMIPGELREKLLQHMRSIRKDAPASMCEVKIDLPGGSVLWIQETYKGVYSEDGRLTEFQIVGRDITDLKRLEDSLKLTQYSVDHSSEIIVWLRPDGSIYQFNEAACGTSGYTSQELATKSIWDIDIVVTPERWQEVLNQIAESRYVELETVHRRKDGSQYPARVSANYIQYSGKEYICTYITDITERRKAETIKEENLRFVQALIDAIPAPLFYKDTAGVYLGCNTAYEKFLGYQKQDIVGRSVQALMSEEIARRYEVTDRTVMEGKPQTAETQGKHADGSIHDAIIYKAPFYGSAGEVQGIVGVILDISDRKRLEEALINAARFSGAVLDAVCASIAVIDETGTITNTNYAWRKFGVENGASDHGKTGVGANYFRVCENASGEASEGAAEALAGIKAILRGEKDGYIAEYACHSPDKKRWFTMKAARLTGAGIPGIVVIHTDITDRKAIEEEIMDYCDALNLKKIKHPVSDIDSSPL